MSTSLYRAFNAGGELLYVGITDKHLLRFRQHGNTKPWWPAVAVLRLEHFESRDHALAAESNAIKAEAPKWNLRGGTTALSEEAVRERVDTRRRNAERRAAEAASAVPTYLAQNIICSNCGHDGAQSCDVGTPVAESACGRCGIVALSSLVGVAA